MSRVHSYGWLWVCILALTGCKAEPEERKVLTVFAAASVGPALDAVTSAFEAEHKNVDVQVELGASKSVCAKVSDQGREADVVISADYEMIDELLVPKHASFNMLIGSNGIVLAYHPQGAVARALAEGKPWQVALTETEVAVGIANPLIAPVGYRALLALELNDRVAPPELRLGARIAAALKPEHQRPDVAKLAAPLSAGELDAAFIYRSEAKQHGLPFVTLDRRIDFSAADEQDFYRAASITLADGKVQHGSAAVYGLTILERAPHKGTAEEFVRFFLSSRGRALAAERHLDLFATQDVRVRGALPGALAELTPASRVEAQ